MLLLFLLWISSFFPEQRLWGINHWAYFPLWLRTAVIATALGLFIPEVNLRVRNFLTLTVVEAFSSLMERRKYLGYALTAVTSVTAFHLLRTKVHLLGDGFQILENINAGLLLANWSQPLAIWIYLSSYKFLHPLLDLDGAAVYALVSYISGVTYVIFALKTAFLLTKKPSTQLFVFLSLIFMGGAQLFFGYAEHYPPLFCGVLIYLFYSLKFLRGEGKILTPVIIFLLLLPLHLSSLYLFPSVLFLFWFGEGGKSLGQSLKSTKAVLALFFLLLLLGVLFLYVRQYRWFALSYFVPLLHGGYTGPDYTLFSLSHVLDFINQQLLISPVGLALFLTFVILKPKPLRSEDRIFQFLLIVSLAQLLFNFLINPGLGASRDWDLFASAGLGYVTLALYVFSRVPPEPNISYLKLNLIVVAFLFALPWVLINAEPDRSVARFRNLLDLDLRKSRNGHFILAAYFDRMGKREEVDRENGMIKEKFPEVELANQGLELLQAGDLERAYRQLTQSVQISPNFAEAHYGLAHYYIKKGDLQRAETELKRAIELKPDYGKAYAYLGDMYMQKQEFKTAKEFYERSVKLGMDSPKVFTSLGILHAQFGDADEAVSFYNRAISTDKDFVEPRYGLAHIYYQQGKLRESLKQINLLLRIDPGFALGYYQLGLTYEGLGRKKEAASAYQRYVQMQPNDPRADYIKQLIERLKTE